MNAQQQLVADARQIATYRGYTNLTNGLQPRLMLLHKYIAEWEEFKEAIAGKSIEQCLHEASDLLYYAACLDTQGPEWPFDPYDGYTSETLVMVRAYLSSERNTDLDNEQIEAAALAKYAWRAAGPDNKNEEYELSLIQEAIQTKE